MLFKNLFRSKARALLTMTGIAVGAFAVAIISQISATGAAEVSGILDNMGINTVLVQSRQVNTPAQLGDEDIISLGAIQGVGKAMPLMSAETRAELLHTSLSCLVWGIGGEAKEIISLKAIHGRLIDDRDVASSAQVCVIDENIALATYGRSNITGKKISLLIGGSYREFEVIGVASSGLSVLQSALAGIIPDFVYLPFSVMQEYTGRETYDKIAVLLDGHSDNGSAATATERIEARLNDIGSERDLIASNLLQQKNQLQNIMSTITLVLSIIAGISLLVAGLTIMTTMLVSVSERIREIGIKKSVGAGDFDIMREFLTESALLALVGSAAGSCLAFLVSAIGCHVLGIGFTMGISALVRFIMPVMFSVLLGIIFGVYPALKAAKLKPIEALRM